MHAHDLAPWQIPAPHEVAPLGDLPLEGGGVIEDFHQSYVTHGRLDAERDNAILVCSAISGDHHRLDFLIGEGKALDPARWFIVCADPIGNGLSTSPSNSLRQPGMQFPRFTIRDMVNAQHRLLGTLGIPALAGVVGASMGGMQALQWAVSRPLPVDAIVAMNAAARTSPWSAAVNEAARACLMADPNWDRNRFVAPPERGWRAWFMVQRVLASRSPDSIEADVATPAELAGHLARWAAKWRRVRPDAHDFLYQSWAYDAHDVGDGLATVTARTLLLAPKSDLYNPIAGIAATAQAIPDAKFVEIPSMRGHQSAAGVDPRDVAFLNDVIGEFLAARA